MDWNNSSEEYDSITGDNMHFLHSRVVQNYKNGHISISVNPGLSLRTYSKISDSPVVKLFRLFVLIYSFPVTIIGVIIISLFTGLYWHCLSYFIGLFILIAIEAYVSRTITLNYALKSNKTFVELHRKGVIKIITEPEI
jgi:hypothetical protein